MLFSKRKESPLLELRNKLLSGEARISQNTGRNEVTAVILDVGAKKGAYSLLVTSDGSCSLYFEKGGGIIGAGQHKNVQYPCRILLKKADEFVEQPALKTQYRLPKNNDFLIHILTNKGNCEFAGNTKLFSDASKSTKLFYLCNSVITQLRLLSERENIPFTDDQILINFIKENNYDAFCAALEDLNNPNAAESGKSALMFAVYQGHRGIIKQLISKGVKIDYKDANGLNALMVACQLGEDDLIEDLLDECTLNSKDNYGQTPLMYACYAGKFECVKSLIDRNAEVNAKDNEGSHPLMFAAQFGYDPIVKYLIEKGADKSITGNHGYKAIDVAMQNKHVSTVDLLRD